MFAKKKTGTIEFSLLVIRQIYCNEREGEELIRTLAESRKKTKSPRQKEIDLEDKINVIEQCLFGRSLQTDAFDEKKRNNRKNKTTLGQTTNVQRKLAAELRRKRSSLEELVNCWDLCPNIVHFLWDVSGEWGQVRWPSTASTPPFFRLSIDHGVAQQHTGSQRGRMRRKGELFASWRRRDHLHGQSHQQQRKRLHHKRSHSIWLVRLNTPRVARLSFY